MTRDLPTSKVLIAGIWSLLSVVLAFGLPDPVPTVDGSSESGSVESATSTAPPLPADGYYMPQYQDWVGRPFVELDVALWVRNLPDDIALGPQYVIFYRKDCEHCHELMELYFSGSLDTPTTAVAVPERDGFPTENLQAFDCPECRLAELPIGIDWFLQTPVLVRLADGVVECVAEVEPTAPECLSW